MSQPEHYEELKRLISRLLDGRISEKDKARLDLWLRRDARARAVYLQYMNLEVELSCLAPDDADPVRFPLPAPRPSYTLRMAVAAAAVLLCTGAWLWLWPGSSTVPGDATMALMKPVSGKVQIVDNQGQSRSIQPGTVLRAGETLRTSTEQSAVALSWKDGTQLQILGKTALRQQAREKHLELKQGRLVASVKPQPQSRPMVIDTPIARAEVLGTELTLAVSATETFLSVTEGRVRITRLHDNKAVEVPAGNAALVTKDNAMHVHPLPTPPETWKESVEEGPPNGWVGKLEVNDLPKGSAGAVRAILASSVDPKEPDHFRISTKNVWTQGLFSVHPDSHLHITFKLDKTGPVQIMLLTRRANPLDSGGAFVLEPQPTKLEQWWSVPAGQWHRADIPLKLLYSKALQRGLNPKDIPFLLVLSTQKKDLGLVVDQLHIDRNGAGKLVLEPLK